MIRAKKRAVDLLIASVLSIAAVPLILVVALGVMLVFRTRKPFFVQDRIGEGGRKIRIVKVRTLPLGVPEYALKTQMRFDHLPKFAQFLRKTHLDELPQLLLVLRGQMSLVGPRPKMPDAMEPVDPTYGAARVTVPQGITGLWQISVSKTEVPGTTPELDLFYVANRSMRFDLWILGRTALSSLGLRPLIALDTLPPWTRKAALQREKRLEAISV